MYGYECISMLGGGFTGTPNINNMTSKVLNAWSCHTAPPRSLRGASRVDLDLTTTFYAATLHNTGIQLPNEYVYCTNSMHN